MAKVLKPVKTELILQLMLCMSIISTSWAKNVWSSTQISISPKSRVQYTRTEEVLRMCPLLTPRGALPYGTNNRLLRQRLSFRHGDWVEAQPGSTHIVPFLPLDDTKLAAKTKLASFLVTDVSSSGQGQQMRKLRGILQLAIIDGRNHAIFGIPTSGEASFVMDRGLSVLTIEVEGIYQPTENEDVVCMLGCTFLPSPDGGVHFPNIQNSPGTKALEKNCDIKAQLNYPLTYNLTSQIVRGTIQSLVAPGEKYHFSPITFSSQFLGRIYEPAAEGLVDAACAAADPFADLAASTYKANLEDFCSLSRIHLQHSWLDIEPNWGCNSTIQNCSNIGPFASYGPQTSYMVDYNTSRARILVKRFTSTPCYTLDDPPSEEKPFSFVFRLVPADESDDLANWRAGLDGHTLVAEGHWTNRSHSLCMLACRMDDSSGQTDNCDSRISLHIPSFLSITQRNIFRGSISSLLSADDPTFFYPLFFHVKLNLRRGDLPFQYTSSLRYNYSRLAFAGAVLDKYEPESASKPKRAAWFKYPSLIGEEDGHYQSLADDLTFHNGLKSKSPGQKWSYLNFDLVAIDKYLPFLWAGFVELPERVVADEVSPSDTIVTQTDPKWTHRKQEARKYLNCSATLEFLGGAGSILTIFTEGYYNPLDGKMYMVGCRSITGWGTWQDMEESSFDLIDGMDCEIEIVLKYPTTLSAWLLKPGVEVKVHSNRPVDDVYHFEDIATETYPILYKGQRETIVSRKSVEGALSILTLSLTLVCVVGQLLYIQTREECTPYISLSMLAAQALGYAIPLITGAESLLARKFNYRKELFLQESGSVQMIIYLDKILTLVALLLFLRLFEKVWRERSMLSELGEADNVPRERKVVVICLIIHAVGFVSVLGLHSKHSVVKEPIVVNPPWTDPFSTRNHNLTLYPVEEVSALEGIRRGPLWQVSQEYTGLIEDLFLLPQAVGFSLWDVAGRPLRVSFIVGLSLLQIVPHVYDYLRSTRFGSYDEPIYANPTFDFYTHLGNILIPSLALFLAVVVYCQQRWKGFLRFPRRFLYQPLGAKRSETELVTTNGRSHLPPIPEDEE